MQPNPVCLFLSCEQKIMIWEKIHFLPDSRFSSQLIKFIDKKEIQKIAAKHGAERYVKKFTTKKLAFYKNRIRTARRHEFTRCTSLINN